MNVSSGYVSTLDENSRRALRVIRDKGVISGWELVSLTHLKPDELVNAVKELLKSDLVAFSGDPFSPQGILESYFNLRPSARQLADFHLKFGT